MKMLILFLAVVALTGCVNGLDVKELAAALEPDPETEDGCLRVQGNIDGTILQAGASIVYVKRTKGGPEC